MVEVRDENIPDFCLWLLENKFGTALALFNLEITSKSGEDSLWRAIKQNGKITEPDFEYCGLGRGVKTRRPTIKPES